MAYITKKTTVDGVKPIGSNLYGSCATASGTADKAVSMPDFNVLVPGVTIHVGFSNKNTASSPRLKVGSTSAVAIKRNGSLEGVWESGSVISFTYDGTNWVQNDADISGKTYGLSYDDTTDTLELVEGGGSQSVTITDDDTTYTISISGHTITLTPSSGAAQTITLPDDDTAYTLHRNLETITHMLYVNLDGRGYFYDEDNFVTNNDGYEYTGTTNTHQIYIVDNNGNDITGISSYNLQWNGTMADAYTFGQNLYDYFLTHNAYRLKIDGVLTQKITRYGTHYGLTEAIPDYDRVTAEVWDHDGTSTGDYFYVIAQGVVLGNKNTIDLVGSDGTTLSVSLKAIDIGALPTAQYHVNDKVHHGYVPAPSTIHPNQVWKTDNDGNPHWRNEEDEVVKSYKALPADWALAQGWLSDRHFGTALTPEEGKLYVLVEVVGNYPIGSVFAWDATNSTYVQVGGGDVTDVQVNGASVVSNTIANILPSDLINIFYPVGSYYETSDTAFDPNVAWGGTWVKDSAGRVTVAQDTSDTAFDVIGETGGSSTHNHSGYDGNVTLTAAQSGNQAQTITSGSGGSHSHDPSKGSAYGFQSYKIGANCQRTKVTAGGTKYVINSETQADLDYSGSTTTVAAHTHSVTVAAKNATTAHRHTISADSNLQPYIVVNRWHRTA